MGSVCFERLVKLVPEGLGTIAIETGTCKGYGARDLAKHFERVITIELSEELHRGARERLRDRSNVECVRGSSPAKLAEILPTLGNATVFFFLDAHWSGDRTVPWQESKWKGYGHDTAHLGVAGSLPSGPEQSPLREELAVIAERCRGPAYVLIDDVRSIGQRDAGFPGENWTHLAKADLLSLSGSRLAEFRELEKPAQWFLRLTARLEDCGAP